MKKVLHLSICLLLVISLLSMLSVDSMATITDEDTNVRQSGTVTTAGKTYTYDSTTTASTRAASAALTCSGNIRLTAGIAATVLYGTDRYTNSDFVVGVRTVYVSVTNKVDRGYGKITKATSTYYLGTKPFEITID